MSPKGSEVEHYRKLCDELDHLVNRPDPIDKDAVADLRWILEEINAQLG